MTILDPPNVQYLTKGELAYRSMRRHILYGDLEPGSVINQVEFAASLNMSTTPLREALNRLQSEGLVYTDAGRDTRVVELNAQEALHIYEVRLVLDPLSAKLAAARRSEAEVRELRGSVERLGMAINASADESIEAHNAFHRLLYSASHNPILVGQLDTVWARSDRYRRFGDRVIAKRSAAERHREHVELMELVAAGAADEAAEAMRAHVEGSLVSQATTVLAQAAGVERAPEIAG